MYAEITLSVGVMLLRKQDVAANFAAIREAAAPFEHRGLRMQWIFDAVRQFGPAAAREVARCAVDLRGAGVIAFGMGGDELALPAAQFRDIYEYAAANGLHRLVHAGEIGGPDSVRDAVEILGAERIGHGIAAAADPELMALLAERVDWSGTLPYEQSVHRRLGAASRPPPKCAIWPNIRSRAFFAPAYPSAYRPTIPPCSSTSLNAEYATLEQMGLRGEEILRISEGAFRGAFLPAEEKVALLQNFRAQAAPLGLL